MAKSSGERVTLWKIRLLMFISPNTWLFVLRIVFHLSMVSNRGFFRLFANRIDLIGSFSQEFGTISQAFL